MATRLYMDHHVSHAITLGLRLRKVDVLTAYEDGAHKMEDSELLDRAGASGRVLFTQDDDLLVEATRPQRAGIAFGGVIYAHQLRVSIGTCVHELEIIAQAGNPEDFINQVTYIPT